MLSEHLQRGKRKKQIKAFFSKKYKDTYLLTWPTGHAQFTVFFSITENKVSDESRNDSLFIWHKRNFKELPQHRLYQETPRMLAAASSIWAKPCWRKVMWEAVFVTQSKLVYFFPLSLSYEDQGKAWSDVLAVLQRSFSLIPDRQRTALPLTKRNK